MESDQPRQSASESDGIDPDTICIGCGSDNSPETMVICDKCDNGFHTACFGMTAVPDADSWHCLGCTMLQQLAVGMLVVTESPQNLYGGDTDDAEPHHTQGLYLATITGLGPMQLDDLGSSRQLQLMTNTAPLPTSLRFYSKASHKPLVRVPQASRALADQLYQQTGLSSCSMTLSSCRCAMFGNAAAAAGLSSEAWLAGPGCAQLALQILASGPPRQTWLCNSNSGSNSNSRAKVGAAAAAVGTKALGGIAGQSTEQDQLHNSTPHRTAPPPEQHQLHNKTANITTPAVQPQPPYDPARMANCNSAGLDLTAGALQQASMLPLFNMQAATATAAAATMTPGQLGSYQHGLLPPAGFAYPPAVMMPWGALSAPMLPMGWPWMPAGLAPGQQAFWQGQMPGFAPGSAAVTPSAAAAASGLPVGAPGVAADAPVATVGALGTPGAAAGASGVATGASGVTLHAPSMAAAVAGGGSKGRRQQGQSASKKQRQLLMTEDANRSDEDDAAADSSDDDWLAEANTAATTAGPAAGPLVTKVVYKVLAAPRCRGSRMRVNPTLVKQNARKVCRLGVPLWRQLVAAGTTSSSSSLAGTEAACRFESMCGPQVCTFNTCNHIAWSVPALPPSYFLPSGHMHCFFFFVRTLVTVNNMARLTMLGAFSTGPVFTQMLAARHMDTYKCAIALAMELFGLYAVQKRGVSSSPANGSNGHHAKAEPLAAAKANGSSSPDAKAAGQWAIKASKFH